MRSDSFHSKLSLRPIKQLRLTTWSPSSFPRLNIQRRRFNLQRQPPLNESRFLHSNISFVCSSLINHSKHQRFLPMSMSMSVPHPRNSRVSHLLLFSSIFLTFLPGLIISADVTLSSIEIFTTHEWLRPTPTVYFLCRGENKTHLPDVKNKHVFYAFKGEESWQPLTNFSGKKCKRCGIYEEDKILSDDVFDEWELCPSDFTSPDGRYVHFKEKEFNASFLCPECLSFSGAGGSISAPAVNQNEKGMSVAVIILISVLVSTILILGMVGAYKYWQKKKREQDQARFLKLFEEGDDIEDELGLGTII